MDLNQTGEVVIVSAIEHKSNVINHKTNHQRKPVGLLRPMNTDTGTTNAAEVVELKKRINELEADNGVNKRKLVLYEENIKRLSNFISGGGGLSSKHKRNKKGSGDDVDTCLANLTCYLTTQLWHMVKMLPKNWADWNEDEKSVCQKLLRQIRPWIPKCFLDEIFWHVHAAPATSDMYVTKRNNSTGHMKKIFEGELILYCYLLE